MSHTKLIVLLGDQLTPHISSLKDADPKHDRILMVEALSEASYVRHHKKKIAFIFSAMRHFARDLKAAGWTVDYVKLDDPKNLGTLTDEVERATKKLRPERIIITEPGEWRVLELIQTWPKLLDIPIDIHEDTRFFCRLPEFETWAKGRKQLRMEYFYREMRKKTGFLMEDDAPIGGKWNFDQENRKPAKASLEIPDPLRFKPDQITRDVLKLVESQFDNHFGDLTPFWFGVTSAAAKKALRQFVDQTLPQFGDYQDAMLLDEKFLYHSVLSLYINIGLLTPLEVCEAVQQAFHQGRVPLNAAEGFIRQIIGWREFIRGIYWLHMPEYVNLNYFAAERQLPDFYWTADTQMTCLRSAIEQTREEAYAHHIQRLMVTGNFAMLAGINPRQVHEWYLSVYADAFEWVELPNTMGMSQFGDGGVLASKPYASSGNYINKMSDYCQNCHYDVKKKTGENACPFNYLYWDFLDRNKGKLRGNPRLSFPYKSWDRMSQAKKNEYLQSAKKFLGSL